MKRLIAILLSIFLLATLTVGCKKEEKEESKYVDGGMKIATSTGDFASYTQDLKKKIDYLAESGFRYADLRLYNSSDMEPFLKDNWKEYAKEIKDYAATKNITFVQAHAIGGNAFKDETSYNNIVKNTIRGIEVCKELGIPNIVVHPGNSSDMDKEAYFAANKDFYAEFFKTMEETGVNVLVENSSQTMIGHYCIDTGADLREFLEYVNHPQLKACWDTGHANIEGDQYYEILDIGDLLAGIHISDNLGDEDNHMMPYQGTVNFDEVLTALVQIGYEGAFTFECENNVIYGSNWLNSRNDFDKSMKVYAPPIEIKISMEKTMLEIGEYMLTQYDIPLG